MRGTLQEEALWRFIPLSQSARRSSNLRRLRLRKFSYPSRTSTKKRTPQGRPFLCGRGDKIRTCDFYVPNVALYQAEPHLVMKLFEALRALPVAVPEICCLLFASPNFDRGHSFLLACSATGSARKRPQAEPHLVISYHNIIAEGGRFVKCFAQKRGARRKILCSCLQVVFENVIIEATNKKETEDEKQRTTTGT